MDRRNSGGHRSANHHSYCYAMLLPEEKKNKDIGGELAQMWRTCQPFKRFLMFCLLLNNVG